MDKGGLGTVSTRTNILRTLLERKYIRYSGKYVVPTPKGLFLYETVRGMKVADASLTSGWETELARIEQGELSQEEFLDGVLEPVNEVTGEIFRNHPVEKRPQGTILNKCQSQQDKGSADVCLYFLLFFHGQDEVFPILSGKGLGLPRFCRKAAPFGAWLVKENHPRFAAVFSFAKPCAKRQSKGRRPIKSGKHIPMGLFILKNLKI